MSALLIKLRPTGPWRIGPGSGDRDRVDRIYHSDSLYAAVCSAMARLGELDAWLDATARAEAPAVRLSSCFPFYGDTLYVVPPGNIWPPPASPKIRFKGARFVPLRVVETLLQGKALSEDNWVIDGASECLISGGAQGPFRVDVRSNAAVDRAGSGVAPHSTACLEFTPGAGLWFLADFQDQDAHARWRGPLEAALRWLADAGFGGGRSKGWGGAEMPEISDHLPKLFAEPQEGADAYWLLSLFHPAETDAVDWQQGSYSLTTRGGRVDASGAVKKSTRMLNEGSVVVASSAPRGTASNVAPEEFPHPVYRAGFALAIAVPLAPAGRQA